MYTTQDKNESKISVSKLTDEYFQGSEKIVNPKTILNVIREEGFNGRID